MNASELDLRNVPDFVHQSRAMENAVELARTVARVDTTLLITGERGAGKDRLARFIHAESPRAGGPFGVVNCSALPEMLLESRLFGHVAGSFAGATRDQRGLLEEARGGTVFLDEVADLSPATQSKLLRVLQEREVHPVGATDARPIDVRIIAATHRDLEAMVGRGELRKDLYYRLKVVSVELPPLRDRREDILPLARELLDSGLGQRSLAPDAADALTAYRWPGNVRELENAIERAISLTVDRETIERDDLPPEIRDSSRSPGIIFGEVVEMAVLEKRYILEVLERFDGNRTHTARALGIGANTLWRKLKAWGVPPARP